MNKRALAEIREQHARERPHVIGRDWLRNKVHEAQERRTRLEEEIAQAGYTQRTRGPLSAADAAQLEQARAELDALNVAVYRNRQRMKGEQP